MDMTKREKILLGLIIIVILLCATLVAVAAGVNIIGNN